MFFLVPPSVDCLPQRSLNDRTRPLALTYTTMPGESEYVRRTDSCMDNTVSAEVNRDGVDAMDAQTEEVCRDSDALPLTLILTLKGGEGDGDGDRDEDRMGQQERMREQGEAQEAEAEASLTSDIRRLRRNILTLSTDLCLLRVRDFISLPIITAFSTSSTTSSTTSNTASTSRPLSLESRMTVPVSSKVRGSVSMTWKKTIQPEGPLPTRTEYQHTDSGASSHPDIDRTGVLDLSGRNSGRENAEKRFLDQGSSELLALLIARILHGLPSKLLPLWLGESYPVLGVSRDIIIFSPFLQQLPAY